ncbi:permease [Streptomyces sp. NBC_00654]|uniref:permease n=1 Tax=Streptomyces sp. NBC_00654 TaxID=2975799 RepID=UPI0022531B86|nr:permease [Streptomyces sp. NBC_00654]MCX4969847.1 permease [Streptomyces sp. NBC_00654]
MSSVTEAKRQAKSSTRRPLGQGGRLWKQLLCIGFAAGRGRSGDRLRFWALIAAAAAIALVALATVIASATYDGRAARNQARGPVITDRQQGAVALWRETFDAVGEVQHTVIYIDPLKPGAQPPPGLDRWPAPGEVMLSPELARQGKHEQITSRYGSYAGSIGKPGLASPSERLAYVRPSQPPSARERESWFYTTGFGQSYPMGEILLGRPLSQVLLALGAMTGVPAVALLVVASRIGSSTRDRRGSLLQALGGSWWHRAVVNTGEAALPLAAGTVLTVLPLVVALSIDIRVPPTGYSLNSDDVRSAVPMMAVALMVSFAICLAVVVFLHRIDRGGATTRPRSFSSKVPPWRLVGCGLGVAAVVFSQYVRDVPGLVVFAIGTVVMWALLPSVVVVACRALGSVIAERGFRTGRPGALIGGRWTVAHPGVIVRLALAMVIGIGLVCQMQVWNSRLGEKAAVARAAEAQLGDRVVSVQSRNITPSVIEDLSRSLPEGSHVFSLKSFPEQQSVLVQGTCRALRSLSLPCPAKPEEVTSNDIRVSAIASWYGPNLQTQVAPSRLVLDELNGSLLVVTRAPGQQAQIEKAAYALVPAVNVESPGETWLVGAANKDRLNNWTLLFGSLGLALLLLTAALSSASEFVRIRQVLAPLAILTGSHDIYRSVVFWHLTVPLLVSTFIATVVTAWHSLFFIAMVQEGSFSWGVLGAAALGCILLTVSVGVLGARTAIRAAQQWRPTAD